MMDIDSAKLTVFFEDPFWVGVFERIEKGKLSVCKVTFGAEPKDYEIWAYLLKNYSHLPFGPSVAAAVKRETANPKRLQRQMLFGVPEESLPYWLQDQSINNICLVATSVWRYMGQNMVLFLGAMMSVNSDLYEAAELDGANKWQAFRHIILPSISTIVTLNLITSISGSLSAFEPPYVITNGTMGTGTYFVIMNRLAHENQKVGLACAMAVVLLVIIIICTVAQKVIMRKLFPDSSDAEAYRAAKEEKARRRAARKAAKAGKEAA